LFQPFGSFYAWKDAEIKSKPKNVETYNQILVGMIREAGRMIIDSGAKIVLIKAGGAGIYLLTGDISSINGKSGLNLPEHGWNFRELWCKASQADAARIVNSNGAGDVAVAAFLSAILDAETAETSMQYAAMAGRNTLYCHNIYTDLPVWQEMTRGIMTESNEMIHFKSGMENDDEAPFT